MGIRINLPSRRVGVGQRPARISSYAADLPIPRMAAAVGTSTALVPSSLARGVGSKQCVRVAAARGVTARTVSRHRDYAVAQLRLARADFEIW